MNQYKIAFFDIDGTLAGHKTSEDNTILSRIPESAKAAIKQLRCTGIEPVIATGRNYGMIKDILNNLEVDNFIANNGRYVVFDHQTIAHDTFDKEHLAAVVDYFLSQKIEFCFETVEKLYIYESSHFTGDGSMGFKTIPDGSLPEDIIQLIVMNADNIPETVPVDGIKMLKVADNVYDVTMNQSSKAIGIQEILTSMNISAEKTIAFGDEVNDLPMFDTVGFSVAMGDGNPDVLQVADYVTTGVYDDGILNACKNLELI
ncbi:Cof-type HAD-IIB family hydrolase [Companilactobacillus jidongensis]|uniref:Cof-type HAD-IIB family hydrolase n=1 Tax=Companilactobacillus jidongensis TaxID=2486006 RepID=UPI000F7A8621|nr:Cof-type HAD-IIB family hydrolase [Companilactobacillus jidongensis]